MTPDARSGLGGVRIVCETAFVCGFSVSNISNISREISEYMEVLIYIVIYISKVQKIINFNLK